jgi:hypothetical protein
LTARGKSERIEEINKGGKTMATAIFMAGAMIMEAIERHGGVHEEMSESQQGGFNLVCGLFVAFDVISALI